MTNDWQKDERWIDTMIGAFIKPHDYIVVKPTSDDDDNKKKTEEKKGKKEDDDE